MTPHKHVLFLYFITWGYDTVAHLDMLTIANRDRNLTKLAVITNIQIFSACCGGHIENHTRVQGGVIIRGSKNMFYLH